MSVICQTFVQNTWKRDLCSNCFKSKDEHGGGGGGVGGGEGALDCEEDEFSLRNAGVGGMEGGRTGSKRYLGVAGRVYQRGYYTQNSWKSLVIDKSDSSPVPQLPATPHTQNPASLRSPGLIRGVATNLVTQENEKNLKLSDMEQPDALSRVVKYVAVPTPQSQAKILSQLLDAEVEEEEEAEREEERRSVEKEEFEKGDGSSDLGSEASHDSAVSSASSFRVYCSAPNSDTASIKSDEKEEEEEEEEQTDGSTREEQSENGVVIPKSILRKPSGPQKTSSYVNRWQERLTFSSPLHHVIGYGGDVDYSDDEDDYDDEEEDDDDYDFDDPTDLTPDERVLRSLTIKNTDFNSDNDNLKKDLDEDELLPSVKELEEKRKIIIAEIEELERLGRENRLRNERVKQQAEEVAGREDVTKQEAKVKLKRSSPLVSTKPLIARTTSTEPRVNQVLPMKNGEVVRPGVTLQGGPLEEELVPLKGIKPKYVSREEEMVEKENPAVEVEAEDRLKPLKGDKVTSIDDVYRVSEKVTSIDEVCPPVKAGSPRCSSAPPRTSPAVSKPSYSPPTPPVTTSSTSSSKSDLQTGETNPTSMAGSKGEKGPSSPPSITGPSRVERRTTKDQTVVKSLPESKEAVKSASLSSASLHTATRTTTPPQTTAASPHTTTTTPHTVKTTSATTPTTTASHTTTTTTTATHNKPIPPVSTPRRSLASSKQEPAQNRRPDTTTTAAPATSRLKEAPKEEPAPVSSHSSAAFRTSPQTTRVSGESTTTKTTTTTTAATQREDKDESIENRKSPSGAKGSTQVAQSVGESARVAGSQNGSLRVTSRGVESVRVSQGESTATTPGVCESPRVRSQSSVESVAVTPAESTCESPRVSSQSTVESCKSPASRQSSTSSQMSTFGTPVLLTPTSSTSNASSSSSSTPAPSLQQNSSFLHSSRGQYDDPCPPNVVAPATPDFLRDIKTPPEVPTPTAGIQKSALYASTSCLKGVPGARPVITPKPPTLKDKPRVPLKPPPSTTRGIYATPTPVVPKLPIGGLTAAISTPNLASLGGGEASGGFSRVGEKPRGGQEQPSPPVQAPTPHKAQEVVYDVPVTLPSAPAPAATPSSAAKGEDAAIYHEINDSLTTTTTSSSSFPSTTTVQRYESTRALGRSTFEANRSLLSAALDFNGASSPGKRPAPRPPEDEERPPDSEQVVDDPGGEAASRHVVEESQRDRESCSSFTDDFDDDDDDTDDNTDPRNEAETRLSPPAAAAAAPAVTSPLYRNSIGPIITHEAPQGAPEVVSSPQVTAPYQDTYQVPQVGRPPTARSHSVPRVSDHVVRRSDLADLSSPSPSPAPLVGGGSSVTSSSSSSSSKFTFSRSGFFRPSSSPPSVKRDTSSTSSSSSERGRERTTKKTSSSSRQFLKKLLRLGSGGGGGSGSGSGGREDERRSARDARRGRPTIIHPLDYNNQGVEVIARPEKTSPIYDYSGIYGYIPPPQAPPKPLQEDPYAPLPQARASPAPSSSSSEPPHSTRGEGGGGGGGGGVSPSPPPSTTITTTTTTTTTTATASSTSSSSSAATVEKKNSFVRKESAGVERRDSAASHSSGSTTQHHLGYNSEGDVRAPITPRKPGRSSSIRGEEDREKRRAPQPPSIPQQAAQEAAQRAHSRHQHQQQDSISSTGSGHSTPRANKGPAPARPPPHRGPSADPHAAGRGDFNTHEEDEEQQRRGEEAEEEEEEEEGSRRRVSSGRCSLQENSGRLSAGRGPLAPRSLQAQYGAVMSANMDALANILDQLSGEGCPPGYEDLAGTTTHWGDITLDDRILVGAGQRLFYLGTLRGREVTLMLTSESKLEAHHLLTPLPLVAFKDDLPSRLLSHRTIMRGKLSPGTVWVLPPLRLTTLRARVREEMEEAGPGEWQRDACLLLLQLVTGLKQLQARGVEETCLDLALVAHDGRDPHPRLLLVPPPQDAGGDVMSLCQCAAAAILLLVGAGEPEALAREGSAAVPSSVPSRGAFVSLLQLLHQERSVSLTQVKRALEVMLFGPESFQTGEEESEGGEEEVEATLERWLDLERATVLHSLTRGPPPSPTLAKFHLLFLVTTSARVLRETVKLLAPSHPPEVTSF